jgi:hypothetical protein
MPVTDEDAALHAIAALHQPSPAQRDALHAIAAILHNDEPFVDVHALFALYDTLYFRNLLLPRVEVLWSPRLTLVRFLLRFPPSHIPSPRWLTAAIVRWHLRALKGPRDGHLLPHPLEAELPLAAVPPAF